VKQETWHRLGEVFHQAIELPADRRAGYLDQACSGDRALRAEIEAMLAAHDTRAADDSPEQLLTSARGRPWPLEPESDRIRSRWFDPSGPTGS
jgi:hypothetical protein